jgi:hypothetical protein
VFVVQVAVHRQSFIQGEVAGDRNLIEAKGKQVQNP